MLQKRLMEIMEERRLSQSDVSRLTGIATSLVSDIVNGKRKRVTSVTLEKLARGLGINVQEFMTGRVTEDDTEYIVLIREFEAEGVTKEMLREFLEWLKKAKK